MCVWRRALDSGLEKFLCVRNAEPSSSCLCHSRKPSRHHAAPDDTMPQRNSNCTMLSTAYTPRSTRTLENSHTHAVPSVPRSVVFMMILENLLISCFTSLSSSILERASSKEGSRRAELKNLTQGGSDRKNTCWASMSCHWNERHILISSRSSVGRQDYCQQPR